MPPCRRGVTMGSAKPPLLRRLAARRDSPRTLACLTAATCLLTFPVTGARRQTRPRHGAGARVRVDWVVRRLPAMHGGSWRAVRFVQASTALRRSSWRQPLALQKIGPLTRRHRWPSPRIPTQIRATVFEQWPQQGSTLVRNDATPRHIYQTPEAM